jgi:hypothetical protein
VPTLEQIAIHTIQVLLQPSRCGARWSS